MCAPVRPSGEILHTTQQRIREKAFIAAAGLPLTPYREVRSLEDLRNALLTNGWRVPGQPLPAAADPNIALPDTDGLPPAGVVEALRTKWLEVTR